VDDLGPATIITGVTHDNGAMHSVAAKIQMVQAGLADWEALVDAPADGLLTARHGPGWQ